MSVLLDATEPGHDADSQCNLELNPPPHVLVESKGDEQPPESDEEDGQRIVDDVNSVWQTCRFFIGIGQAAFKYGSSGGKVERFLQKCLEEQGIEGATVVLSQSELCLSVPQDSRAVIPVVTWIVKIQNGLSLDKLGKLVELAKDISESKVSLSSAFELLDIIDASPDPWGLWPSLGAWVVVGGGLSMLLGGTWMDVWMSAVMGGVSFGITVAFDKLNADIKEWYLLTCSFVVAVITSCVKFGINDLNIGLVTLSAVAIPLPGYGLSLGVAELVMNRIVSGVSNIVQALVTLAWLVLGAALGVVLVNAISALPAASSDIEPVPMAWQALFVPLTAVSVCIAFQNSPRDVIWAVLCQGVAYGSSYGFSLITKADFGTFLGGVFMTLFANVWARWFDRPNTIVLLPSIVLQVSGSIGFRGIAHLLQGETTLGVEQFLQMFVVALLILAGVMAGSTLIKPHTTL